MKIKYIFYVICIVAAIIQVSSCKKGCTNASAVNYDNNANQEDASCLYCSSELVSQSVVSKSVIDNNSSSEFDGSVVIKVLYKIDYSQVVGNGCRQNPAYSLCSASEPYTTNSTLLFINRVNKTIKLSTNVNISLDNGNSTAYSNQFTDVVIQPGDTILMAGNILNTCVPFQGSSSITLSNSNFQYW